MRNPMMVGLAMTALLAASPVLAQNSSEPGASDAQPDQARSSDTAPKARKKWGGCDHRMIRKDGADGASEIQALTNKIRTIKNRKMGMKQKLRSSESASGPCEPGSTNRSPYQASSRSGCSGDGCSQGAGARSQREGNPGCAGAKPGANFDLSGPHALAFRLGQITQRMEELRKRMHQLKHKLEESPSKTTP